MYGTIGIAVLLGIGILCTLAPLFRDQDAE